MSIVLREDRILLVLWVNQPGRLASCELRLAWWPFVIRIFSSEELKMGVELCENWR